MFKPIAHALLLLALLAASFAVPYSIARDHVTIGEGPDEIAHLDHVFFRFTRPSSQIKVEAGLIEPGLAPQGQGHQAPLYYLLHAGLLRLSLPESLVGPFWDYQAGLSYSSLGEYMGGNRACNVRYDLNESNHERRTIRRAIILLRGANAFFFMLSVLVTYLAARLVFSFHPILALSAAALVAGTPTAVWRSSFVTNDNLVSLIGSLTFLIAVAYVKRGGMVLLTAGALAAAVAFLVKYTGAAY